ncbi:MAG: ice-binding family protein [Pseudomonadota bacterium]
MNDRQKYLASYLPVAAALFSCATAAFAAAPSLGTVSGFAVLGGSAVTCTSGVVAGDAGVSPGSAFTNTGCTYAGATPPATTPFAATARADFLTAYAGLQAQSASCTYKLGTTLAGENLAPGVYCLDAVAKTGVLTLTGPADGVWVFLVNGALTGTNFSVAMTGGGQPCNVFWAPSAAATLTTSALKGNILAGDSINGSITLTGGTMGGRALAAVAVTMTDASIVGCGVLTASSLPGSVVSVPGPVAPPATCTDDEHEGRYEANEHRHMQMHM